MHENLSRHNTNLSDNMTILYFGTYEETYSRNQILTESLNKMGHTVKKCHVSLWGKRVDKSGLLSGGFQTIIFFCRLLAIYPLLLLKFLFIGHYDLIFVGYFGHLDMFFVKFFQLIAFRKKKKIVFDVFVSLYDSIISDRKMLKADSFLAKFIFMLDKVACSFADVLLLDTDAHIDFFHHTFKVPKEKMIRIYASADTSVFYPRKSNKTNKHNKFNVLFMGKYTPLHGIEHIVEAADILRDNEKIHFIFIGKGQLAIQIRSLAETKNLENIEFIDWVEYETLPFYIENADVCLGIFADSDKASRVIPNKVFQSMAMGKAIITGNTKGIREALKNGENAILCTPADPVELAQAILRLEADSAFREKMGSMARQTFETNLGNKAVVIGLEHALIRCTKKAT